MGQGELDRRAGLDALLREDVDYRRPAGGGGAFFDLVAPLQGRIVLDLGCGLGIYRNEVERRGGTWIGIDLAGSAPRVHGDASRLPLAGAAVDDVLCSAVLEHLPEPGAVLDEVHRVLRPGGRFFGYVAFLEPFHGISYFHMTHMGLDYLLRKHGFRPRRVFPSHVGLGYQLEALLFPRPVPVLQPLCRAVIRGSLAVAMAGQGLLRRLAGRHGPAERERLARLLPLKYSVGFNFIAERATEAGGIPAGYPALVTRD